MIVTLTRLWRQPFARPSSTRVKYVCVRAACLFKREFTIGTNPLTVSVSLSVSLSPSVSLSLCLSVSLSVSHFFVVVKTVNYSHFLTGVVWTRRCLLPMFPASFISFMAAFVAQVQQLKFGDLETSFMGPLISHAHRDKVESYVSLAKSEGTFHLLPATHVSTQKKLSRAVLFVSHSHSSSQS
jgi:hypothetical protein